MADYSSNLTYHIKCYNLSLISETATERALTFTITAEPFFISIYLNIKGAIDVIHDF